MKGTYLGHLSRSDPLYSYLQEHISPHLGFNSSSALYRAFKFTCSQSVYLYEERHSNIRIVA